MKSSRFAELVATIGFLIGGVITMNSRGGLYQFGALISVVSLVWYFKWGSKLSGWVGQTDADMHDKLKKIEREIEAVAATPAGPERYKKEAELSNKKIALEGKQWELRAATSQLIANTVFSDPSKTEFSEAKTFGTVPIQDPRYTFAMEQIEAAGGYMAIFRRGTEAQQTSRLNEIMSYMHELNAIDAWIEDVKKMSVDERTPLRERVEKTIARKVEIFKQICRPF